MGCRSDAPESLQLVFLFSSKMLITASLAAYTRTSVHTDMYPDNTMLTAGRRCAAMGGRGALSATLLVLRALPAVLLLCTSAAAVGMAALLTLV